MAETGRLVSDKFAASFHEIELGENMEKYLDLIQTETEAILGLYRQHRQARDREKGEGDSE